MKIGMKIKTLNMKMIHAVNINKSTTDLKHTQIHMLLLPISTESA